MLSEIAATERSRTIRHSSVVVHGHSFVVSVIGAKRLGSLCFSEELDQGLRAVVTLKIRLGYSA